jgi:hypothetical protein
MAKVLDFDNNPGNGKTITLHEYSLPEGYDPQSLGQQHRENDQKQEFTSFLEPDMYRLLTTTLFKRKYDISYTFIGELRKEGLPYFLIGSRCYYRIDDIEAFLLKYKKIDK